MLHCGYGVPLVMCSVVFVPTYLMELWPKSPSLVSSDHNTFSHMLFGNLKCVFAKFSRAQKFFLPLYPIGYSPDIWRIQEIVVTCTTQPVLTGNSCSSCNVAVGLLAASLTSFLLIFSSILEGHPVLGNITVDLYFLHLMMTVFTVFHGISNALEILLYPSPDWDLLTMRSLWFFGSSLQTRAFAVRCD